MKAKKVFIPVLFFISNLRSRPAAVPAAPPLDKKTVIYYHMAMKFDKFKKGPLDMVILAGALINLLVIVLILVHHFSG